MKKGHRETHSSVGQDLPTLVITFVPIPEDYSSAIMHTSRILVTMISIHIKMNIIDHPYSSVAITQVPALSPQNRLIKIVWIVRYQPNWMSGADGMLNGLTSDLVDQSKSRATLFILHPGTVLLILVPMLVLIAGIRWCKNDLAMANGEGVIWGCFGYNLESGFVRERSGCGSGNLMADMVNVGRRIRGGGVMGLVRNMVDGGVGNWGRVTGNRWWWWVTGIEGVISLMMMVRRRRRWRGRVIEVMGHVS